MRSSDGTIVFLYQSSDGAVHELRGNGSPNSTNFYADDIVLDPGEARKGSPLAVTDASLGSEISEYDIVGFCPSFCVLFFFGFFWVDLLLSDVSTNNDDQTNSIL